VNGAGNIQAGTLLTVAFIALCGLGCLRRYRANGAEESRRTRTTQTIGVRWM